jgi:4-aminobutyrate aminotransferase-like enzyme
VLGGRSLMASWEVEGEALHTATFLANPLSCAAALAVLGILEEEGLIGRAAALGETVGSRLRQWESSPQVAQIRGRGLLWGIEIEGGLAATIAAKALRRGVLVLPSGPEGRVLQICPPLTIARSQLDESLSILERLLEEGETSE